MFYYSSFCHTIQTTDISWDFACTSSWYWHVLNVMFWTLPQYWFSDMNSLTFTSQRIKLVGFETFEWPRSVPALGRLERHSLTQILKIHNFGQKHQTFLKFQITPHIIRIIFFHIVFQNCIWKKKAWITWWNAKFNTARQYSLWADVW